MAMSPATPPKKTAKGGKTLLQMEPQTPFDTQQSAAETDDSPPVEVRPPVSKGTSNPKPFPIPPKASLKGGYCEEAVGMGYWRSIPTEFKDRLTVYINREHPVLNRMVEVTAEDAELMRQHKKRYPIKYIDLPPEPFSEDTAGEFLNRYGSGKYKVFVNDVGIKGAKDPNLQSRNLCKFLVKVYDSDSPPILDPSRPDKGLGVLDWTHPENQSYVAELRTRGILPPDEKAGDSVAESVVTTLVDKISDLSDRVGVHETDRLVDRIAEKINSGGGQSRASETLQIMQATKEMLTPAKTESTVNPAPPADPFDTADKIMKMRQNDPMITLLLSRMDAQDKALEAARTREFDLLKEKAAVPPVQPKSLVDQAVELAGAVEKLSPLKALFGVGTGNAATETIRAGRTNTLDVVRELGGKLFDQDWASVITALMNRGNPAMQAQQMNGTAIQPQNEEAAFQSFIRDTLNPALRRHYLQGFPGGTLAGWLYDAFPDRLKRLQNFTHPLAPGLKGAPVIIGAYKRTPDMWPLLSEARPGGEAAFVQFVNEFCAWQPEPEEDSNNGVIDAEIVHEGEQGEEAPERIS